jgi:hypothetical protein
MTTRRLALALVVAAAALVAIGLAVGSTDIEFGALAVIGAAWLVHDFARSAQATP